MAFLAVACVTTVVIANVWSNRYLDRYKTRFQREVAELRERSTNYRRPVRAGEPVDDNAARWYRKALPHSSDWSADRSAVATALKQGVGQGPATATDRVNGICRKTQSAGVRKALRCTHCDWDLKFGVNDLDAFDRAKEASTLGSCFVLEGHRAAHEQDWSAAARSYLDTVAVGCDMARGSMVMSIVGIASAHVGLTALAQLVMTVDDTDVLRDVSEQLSAFEGKLPDANTAFRHERLWLENALSLQQLDSQGALAPDQFFSPKVIWAAWQLSREEQLLGLVRQVTDTADRNQRLHALEEFKKRLDATRITMLRTMAGVAELPLAADDLVILYRATQAAIELQDWHVHHHLYPPDGAGLRVHLDRYGIRYEPLESGAGYRLIGPLGRNADAVILERQPR